MQLRHRLALPVFTVVLLFALLSGCNAGVEAFSVSLDASPGAALDLRDLQRRPAEDEALVSAGTDGGRRFQVRGLGNVPDAVVSAVVVELSGAVSGGLSIVIPGQAPTELGFASTVRATTAIEQSSLRLRLPLDTVEALSLAALEDAELVFTASAGSYRIRDVQLETRATPPRVRLPGHPDGTLFDARLPVSVGPSETVIESSASLRISYDAEAGLFDDREDRPAMTVSARGPAGAEDFRVQLRPGRHDLVFRPGVWLPGATAIAIADVPVGVRILSAEPVAAPATETEPIPIELTDLLNAGTEGWRRADWELYSWSLYPNILWIDSLSYEVQARLFRRLAFFVEKRGFIGTLLTDAELAGRHGWNAHNYRPEGLAAFYNAVQEQDFPINRYEQALLEVLLANGIVLQADDGTYLPGTGGILAVSQESYYELRRLLIVHEALHGIFYEEQGFVDDAFALWRTGLESDEREFWQTFFGWMTYSPDDEYLMVNEMQAYLMQQQEPAVRWYFRTRIAGRLRNGLPGRVDWLNGFLANYPTTFRRAADVMNASLFRHAGMVGGDPFCLIPISAEG